MSERNNQEKFKDILGLASHIKQDVRKDTTKSPSEPVNVLDQDKKYQELDLPIYPILVELPSKGIFYREDHPLFNKTHIEIKEVSGKEEKILYNKSYIKAGIAVSNFIKAVLLNEELKKPINFDEIIDADRSAILVAARISAFGEEYETQIMCPNCAHKCDHKFDLNSTRYNAGYFNLPEEEKGGVTHVSGPNFEFELKDSHIKIMAKISNQGLSSKIERLVAADKNLDFSVVFADLVISVNDSELTELQKLSLHDMLRSSDLRYFKKIIKKITPSFDIISNWKCEKCEIELEMDAPISSRFLFPDI